MSRYLGAIRAQQAFGAMLLGFSIEKIGVLGIKHRQAAGIASGCSCWFIIRPESLDSSLDASSM